MRTAGAVFGALILVIGVLALLGTLGGGLGLVDTFNWLWPLLIVGLGLWLILAASSRRRAGPPAGWPAPPPGWPGSPAGWPAPPASGVTEAGSAGAAPGPLAGSPDVATAPAASVPGSGAAGGSAPGPTAWNAPGPTAWSAPGPGTGAQHEGPGETPQGTGPGWIHQQRFMGEIELAGPMVAGPMRVETFLGEIRLDLSQATFPEGETPIHVSTGIGQVRVLLPAAIPASVRAASLLGATEALGRSSGSVLADVRSETDDFAGATRRIRLDAQAMIGEVAVRRARPARGAPQESAPESRATEASAPETGAS